MTQKLEAKSREILGKKVYGLRQDGKIPAVIYGKGAENKNLELVALDFENLYREAGSNTIIDLIVDGGEAVKVLVTDVQSDPVSDAITHADLKLIRMDEKITAHIEIELTGEAPAVKADDGILVHSLSSVEIKCLPGDLIHNIKVDVSSLETFDDTITVADLKLPESVELVGHELEEVVATVTPPKEEEEPVVAEPAEGEEGEEGAEGEGEAKEGEEGDKSAEGSDAKPAEGGDNKAGDEKKEKSS